jgi:hypothetical protein
LTAKPITGMSYVWRSILKGIYVFKEGMLWRMEDGTSVPNWDDPWFPSGITRQPTTHKWNCQLIMVSELIDTATGTWSNARIVQHFLPVDVLTILSIPLREQTDDFVGMAFCFKRYFSIRSPYKYKVHTEMEKNK